MSLPTLAELLTLTPGAVRYPPHSTGLQETSAERAAWLARPQAVGEPGLGSVVDDLLACLYQARPYAAAVLAPVLRERRQHGVRKYGHELGYCNGQNPALDQLQELLDALKYGVQAYHEAPTQARGRRIRTLLDLVLECVHELAEEGPR